MSVRPAAALHVTTGDSVLFLLKKAGIPGTHVAWRDCLYEGPVPAGLTLEETSAVRARYASERGYGNPIKIIHEFEARDATLRKAGDFSEVVLWFEHDLYDQLQMLQVLTSLEELALDPGRVALIQADQYLGTMTADEFSPLLNRRRTVTAATFTSARRAWERFTSSSPAALLTASREDAIGLPYLRAALQRLCEEYPGRDDGLSRSQRHALAAATQGPAPEDELYVRAQSREEASFLSDAAFSRLLADLRDPRAPLIEGGEGAFLVTPLGRRVLAGQADWLQSYPIDRWIGGVRLMPAHVVRWDERVARFDQAGS